MTMFTKLKQTFIGRPLKHLTEGEGRLLGKIQVLAILSSDALSSIANGPEQVVLIPQFIPNKPWQNILHNQMSLKLKYALRCHQDVVVASYSYHLKA